MTQPDARRAARSVHPAKSGPESPDQSRLLRWVVAIGLGVPLALIVLAAAPLGTNFLYVTAGIPALLIAWAMAGVGALWIAVRSAMRKDWRQCLVASLLPIVLLVVVAFDPVRFVRACNYIGDVAHFIVAKPYYDRQIAALPAGQGPRLATFDWGGMVWASFGVVYDETDQLSLPRGRQSPDWLERASHTELSCEGYDAQPLWDHYYLVSFAC
jgi:hypothetical protein